MSTGRLLALLFSIAAAASADPQLTIIQDTLYKADGTKMNGSAVIAWNSFQSADTNSVGMQTVSVPIVNGSIYVQLVPNTTAVPSYPYVVTYSSSGKIQFQETWMVPSSPTPLHVRDVRTSTTSISPVIGIGGLITGSGGSTGGPVDESSVTGLTNDLAARPVKGPAFGMGRVALVDQNGALDTVVGNASDCVYVDGTTGPCFDSTKLPTYFDGEIPGGAVDGFNTSFILSNTPSPATSLLLFRNGMMQKPAIDYTLSGSTVLFGAGAGPQPGDTLIAWYRKTTAGAGQQNALNAPAGNNAVNNGVTPAVNSALVLCSASGARTSATALSSLGTCTIPAGTLNQGDRVDIRFMIGHTGTTSAFTFLVKWGSTVLTQRTGGAAEAGASGRIDAMITAAGMQTAGETFGTTLPPLPFLGSAADPVSASIKLDFQAALAIAGSDNTNLVNYSVIRYPAIANP